MTAKYVYTHPCLFPCHQATEAVGMPNTEHLRLTFLLPALSLTTPPSPPGADREFESDDDDDDEEEEAVAGLEVRMRPEEEEEPSADADRGDTARRKKSK